MADDGHGGHGMGSPGHGGHGADSDPSKPSMGGDHGGHGTQVYTPKAGCELGTTTPIGQANPTAEPEPQGAIWCFDLEPATEPSRVKGDNSWVDDFTTGGNVRQFDDGDYDYKLFNSAGDAPPDMARHWVNHNHWMVDTLGGFTGGTSMRPNQSFSFEDSKFVVEADVAVSVPEFGGSHWTEITITDAPQPSTISDNLYAYGQFGQHQAIGCRLQSSGNPVCAHMVPEGATPVEGCHNVGQREMEISFFQPCGNSAGGGDFATDPAHPGFTGKDFARQCRENEMDSFCRDRFRLEITESSLIMYVNGFKYFESSNWPAAKQLPASFINGEVYVYFSNWGHRADGELARFHWDRLAINPGDELTTARSFCLDKPRQTCQKGGH